MISHYYIFIDCKIRKHILDFLKKKKRQNQKHNLKLRNILNMVVSQYIVVAILSQSEVLIFLFLKNSYI